MHTMQSVIPRCIIVVHIMILMILLSIGNIAADAVTWYWKIILWMLPVSVICVIIRIMFNHWYLENLLSKEMKICVNTGNGFLW